MLDTSGQTTSGVGSGPVHRQTGCPDFVTHSRLWTYPLAETGPPQGQDPAAHSSEEALAPSPQKTCTDPETSLTHQEQTPEVRKYSFAELSL